MLGDQRGQTIRVAAPVRNGLKTKAMENKVEALKQQSQDLKGEASRTALPFVANKRMPHSGEKLQSLEEQFRAMEGGDKYGFLEQGRIKTLRDLVEAFLKQYKYNKDMAPDRSQLQNMLKKEQEGFKEYAQRWCKLAMQVQPPITKREMVIMFIDTFPTPYYDNVVGNVASNFTNLVVVGKRIELGIRRGKFTQTNALLVEPGKANVPSYPTQVHIGSKQALTYINPPPMPYTPPYQPRTDTGAATSSRPA
ncbi:hypothetical protein CR513_14083, partial [Mucuna pruriens]